MTKIHKVVNYDHELIKNKDFNDVYKDPDVIKMKRKEKLVDVWSNIMIGLALIALIGLILSTTLSWDSMIFAVCSYVAAGAISLYFLPFLAKWSDPNHRMNVIRVETADILYDRHIQGAKSTQILLAEHDDDFCVVKVISERENEDVDETDLLLYYREKSNIDEPTYDVKECTIYHPKN